MKLLKNLTDNKLKTENILQTREACRVILFDENNKVPILYVSKYKFHKIPGGGIEKGEDKATALAREAKEEAGCEIKILCEIGKISEYRSKWGLKQTSYGYLGKVLSKGKSSFTEKERNNGFKILWLTIDEAITKVENDKTTDYEGRCVQQRELTFLKEAKRLIKSNSKIKDQISTSVPP